MPQIDFRLGTPPGLALLGIILAVGLALYFYRATIPPVPRTRRMILASLRAVALALMALLLCEPLLRLILTSSVPPALTILVDNSRSMSIADRGGLRSDVVRSLLQSAALKDVGGQATIQIVPFGTITHRAGAPTSDSLTFSEDGTDIAGALDAVRDNDRTLHSSAILLITDGVVTLGQNPLETASVFPVPIFTIGIGDSSEQADVIVQRLATNGVVYSGTPTPVQVMVHASGYQNERVDITLTDGAAAAGHATLTLEPGSRDYAVPLTWTPGSEGMHTLTAVASALPGELTTRNNRRTVAVRVRKNKLLVLLLAGGPSSDLSFVRAALEEDHNVRVTSFTQSATGEFLEGNIPSVLLDSVDCIGFIGMPTTTTSPAVMEMVAGATLRRHIPLLWIGGRLVDMQRGRALESLLPFSTQQQSSVEQEMSVAPLPSEQGNPLLLSGDSGGPLYWQQLPPIFTTRSVHVPRPGTTVLATARIQAVLTPLPVLLSRSQAHQRTIALLGYGVWRWRLLAQRSDAVTSFFPQFISNVLHWLTAPEDMAPLVVRPLAALYGQGEPLSFEAQVYDVRQQPVQNADVHVVVQQRNQATEATLASMGNGRYEGTVPGVGDEGVYAYRATAGKGGIVIGTDSGTVRVGGTHVEFLSTQMNSSSLRALAARSGGVFLMPGEMPRLPGVLAEKNVFTPRVTTRGSEIPLRSWPYLAAAIVLLLAVEWFIRKRSGMI
jgi:hypothetical protein